MIKMNSQICCLLFLVAAIAKVHGGLTEITAPTTIRSPNYPADYEDTKRIRYRVTASGKDIIQFKVIDLDTAPNGNSCSRPSDRLWFFDGPEKDWDKLLAEMCGNTVPVNSVFTTGGEGFIIFSTLTGATGYRGWEIQIDFIGGLTDITSPTTITSPGYPGIYPDAPRIRYRVTAGEGQVVRFTVTNLDLAKANEECSGDSDKLWFFDSEGKDWEKEIAELCGNVPPAAPIVTTGPDAYVIFSTVTANTVHTGYSVNVDFVPAP